MHLWISVVSEGNTSAFQNFAAYAENPDTSADIVRQVTRVVEKHLLSLVDSFEQYFPEVERCALRQRSWVQNPFSESAVDDCELDLADKELLIDLAADSSLRLDFNSQTLDKFWISLKAEYPSLHAIALPILLNFSSTYLCESGFSSLLYIKNKYRSKLEVEPPLLIKLSSRKPRIAALCTQLQAHPSH